MPSVRQEAPPPLRDLVECFWLATRDFSLEGGFVVTPDRFVDLLFFDTDVRAEDEEGRHRLPRCALLGPLILPLTLVADGVTRTAGIRLKTWVIGRLCRYPREKRPWSNAAALAGDAPPRILSALRENRSADVFLVLAELANRLLPNSLERDGIDLSLSDDRTGPSVTALAARLHLGERQASRRFKAATRLSPKQYSGVIRFQYVRDRLWFDPCTSLTMLALDAGYADQAHFTREFKRYAGMPPATFARQVRWGRLALPKCGSPSQRSSDES